MPPDPSYIDLPPRKASRLERLRYRLWQRVEAWVEARREAEEAEQAEAAMTALDELEQGTITIAGVVDEIVTGGQRRRALEARRLLRLLLALALAMAGCGGVVGAWIVFGWGGG